MSRVDFRFRLRQWVRFAAAPGHIQRSTTFLVLARSYNEDHHGGRWNSYRVQPHKSEDDGAILGEQWFSEDELEAVDDEE